jgi:nitroimidazol reductase NimA-like FMN-containing flavoprotein (pyridoxamine 5'-phosphate oxidase superfamily)
VVTRQGPVSLIHDPAARRLLHSAPLAHLACNWRDGTPRVVPIGFRWNGQELVLASAAGSPRTKALAGAPGWR